MKIYFHKNIKSISGRYKNSDIVYSAYKDRKICIARAYVKQKTTIYNIKTGIRTKQIASLWKNLSIYFKTDCKRYAKHYNKQFYDKHIHPLTGYNIFFQIGCY